MITMMTTMNISDSSDNESDKQMTSLSRLTEGLTADDVMGGID